MGTRGAYPFGGHIFTSFLDKDHLEFKLTLIKTLTDIHSVSLNYFHRLLMPQEGPSYYQGPEEIKREPRTPM